MGVSKDLFDNSKAYYVSFLLLMNAGNFPCSNYGDCVHLFIEFCLPGWPHSTLVRINLLGAKDSFAGQWCGLSINTRVMARNAKRRDSIYLKQGRRNQNKHEKTKHMGS
jgi:hypothetical protein